MMSTTNPPLMTDPERSAIVARLHPVHRAILGFIEVDPTLATPRSRLVLTHLVGMLVGECFPAAIGQAVNELHSLHQRGFPVSAFANPKPGRRDVKTAHAELAELRSSLGHSGSGVAEDIWRRGALRVIGYSEEDIRTGSTP